MASALLAMSLQVAFYVWKARCVLPQKRRYRANVAPADGQLLIGSDGNYFLNTLQPGPGMLVTNAPATITLAPGGAPVTKTANFDLAADEFNVINNMTGSGCVVTLPAASDWVGRIVNFKNTQAQALDSASSNVVPITGGGAGTAILGNFRRLAVVVSDGTKLGHYGDRLMSELTVQSERFLRQ
jgi:hypothetical protein